MADLLYPLRLGKRGLRFVARRTRNSLKSIRRLSWPFFCPVCCSRVKHFLPIESFYAENATKFGSCYKAEDAETLNVHQYRCPVCRASDRCRLYALYVNRYLKQNPRKTIRFLDIAPSRSLSKFLKSQPTFQIRTADLFAQGVDDVVDICDMKIYQNDSFDALLCSHVLEHVTDDRRAMSELFRVLRPGGWAILMVPINLAVAEIDEDCNVTDPGERWRRFGQDDHVRRYSKAGFVNRLEDAGFRVEQLGVSYFGRRTFSRYGLSPTSVLYIGHKA